MEGIKDTVYGLMQVLEKQVTHSNKNSPQAFLEKAFSKKELAHAKLVYFKKGVMGVSVNSSVWLYHLSLQKESLLDKLRKELPEVKDIRFFAGETDAKEKRSSNNQA